MSSAQDMTRPAIRSAFDERAPFEDDANLRRLANQGVIIAVIPKLKVQGMNVDFIEYCVEASIDDRGRLNRRLRNIALDGTELPAFSGKGNSFSHQQITGELRGRFVGIFAHMDPEQIRQYVAHYQDKPAATPRACLSLADRDSTDRVPALNE
ncbi:hypothetical protein LTS18_011018, partial [Coniosporium uncinatum]